MFSCRPRAVCSTAAATTCKDSYFGQYKKAREEHALDRIAKRFTQCRSWQKTTGEKISVFSIPTADW